MNPQTELAVLLTNLSAALILTVLTEGILTLLLTRRPRYLLFNFWCNALTNPLLNLALFGIRCVTDRAGIYACAVGIGEIAVVLAEYAVYRHVDAKQQRNQWYFRLSLATNAFSFLTGEIISRILT